MIILHSNLFNTGKILINSNIYYTVAYMTRYNFIAAKKWATVIYSIITLDQIFAAIILYLFINISIINTRRACESSINSLITFATFGSKSN